MSESLFSPSWYRVADVRPRLRSHAVIHRHLYRGQVWYVLQDQSSGRFHRFSPHANLVIGLMDGKRTLREIWESACSRLGDDAPTQDDVIGILSSLHRADVLQTDKRPDMQELHERHVKNRRMKLKQYIQNPLSLRFPLFDPTRVLDVLDPLSRWLFGRAGAVLWLCCALLAGVLAGAHWGELTNNFSEQLLAVENLFLIALVFPVAKLVHEFGHAMAIRAKGGEVHEMGVMLLVLMPIPYLDASASMAFREKRDRILVGAAGMASELLLAMLALLVWVSVEPGTVRVLAYNVMLIAGVSTLVFNINPLLRFDGYYMLADLLEIPNLGQRANAHMAYLAKRHLLGVDSATPGQDAPGERAWFVFYAVASFVYRMFIMFTIALLIAQQYFVLGILLAIWSVYSGLARPIARQLGYLVSSSELRSSRPRALAVVAALVALAVVLLFRVPAPSWTRTEGVTVAPSEVAIRAATDGFVVAVHGRPNHPVRRGEPVLTVEDPELDARVRILQAQLQEQRARYEAATRDPVQLSILREEIVHLQARLAEARRRVADLVIRSPGDGVLLLSDPDDLPGRFVRRGELLGYAMDRSRIAVQVVVPQGDVDLVRAGTRGIEVRLVEHLRAVWQARVKLVVPAATHQLPGLALGAQGGGELALAPDGGSASHTPPRAVNSLFVMELELEPGGAAALRHIGSRVLVRFDREPEPLGEQVFRAARRMLLSMFNV